MVIVVEGNNNELSDKIENPEILKLVDSFIQMGMSTKDVINKTSEMLNLKKNYVYSLYHHN